MIAAMIISRCLLPRRCWFSSGFGWLVFLSTPTRALSLPALGRIRNGVRSLRVFDFTWIQGDV